MQYDLNVLKQFYSISYSVCMNQGEVCGDVDKLIIVARNHINILYCP